MIPGPYPSFRGPLVEESCVRLGPLRASRRQAWSICPHLFQTCGRHCCRCCSASRDETRGLGALLRPRHPSPKAPHPLELADRGFAVGVDRLDRAYLRLGSYRPSARRSVTQEHLGCSVKIIIHQLDESWSIGTCHLDAGRATDMPEVFHDNVLDTFEVRRAVQVFRV